MKKEWKWVKGGFVDMWGVLLDGCINFEFEEFRIT
jgi:hypothetical protein